MSRQGMPFLIMNYGAEMVFILEQRLHAQNVSQEKAHKVLQDVSKSMFAPQLVAELMRPQDLYTPAATREVFDRLAQSSIMRLSENSMDKLYDLMTMGCKYQLMVCRFPKELIELTLNHLDSVKKAVGAGGADIIINAEQQLRKTFAEASSGMIQDARQQLLTFFQGKRVKVSLFLQEGIQNTDATFNIPRVSNVAADPPVQLPGTVKYYEGGALVASEQFAHPDAATAKPAEVNNSDAFNPATRTSKLGFNLYMTDRKKKDGAAAAAPAAAAPAPATGVKQPQPLASQQPGSPINRTGKTSSFRRLSAGGPMTGNTAALNSLSAMIVSNVPAEAAPLRINLFDDDGAEGAADAVTGQAMIEIGRVSRDDLKETNAELMGVISGIDAATAQSQAAAGGGDDLLDLMDS